MYQEWTEVLASSRLFRGIAPDALNTMLNCLKPKIKRCRQHEIVAIAGQPFYGVGIVADGKIALTKETYSGDRIILEILESGNIFGEIVAFSDEKVWPVTVITQEDSTLLFLPSDKILGNCPNICISHSTLIMNILNILSNRAILLNKKIEQLSAKNIRGKISSYLLELYGRTNNTALTIPMKRHELADYLGIPRPSLSRELGLMRDAGIIEFRGSSINIKKLLVLEQSLN